MTLFHIFLSGASLLLITVGLMILGRWDWEKQKEQELLEIECKH